MALLSTQKASLVLLLGVALALTIASSQGNTDSDTKYEAMTVEQLRQRAKYNGHPFTEESLERMRNTELWGTKRAEKTVDIFIINASEKTFYPKEHKCKLGSLSPGLLAEAQISEATSTVIGVQSREDDSYAYLKCQLHYSGSEPGAYFAIDIYPRNIAGDVEYNIESGPGIEITEVVSDLRSNPWQLGIEVKDGSSTDDDFDM